MQLQIKGANQLGDLGKRLKAAGTEGKGLKKEIHKSILKATKPMKQDAKKQAKETLPKRGGLNKVVGASRFTTKERLSRHVGVDIITKGTAVKTTDLGMVRHPVFGRRVWVNQSIPQARGWFTDTMRKSSRGVRKEIMAAVKDVSRKIAKG